MKIRERLSRATSKRRASHILKLPNELLIHIAHIVDEEAHQQSLHSLCLVNRQFSELFHGELFCSPVLRPDRAVGFIRCLFQKPRFIWKVRSLRVLDGFKEIDMVDWADDILHHEQLVLPENTHALAVECSKALQELGLEDHSWRWIAGLQAGDPYAYVTFVVAMCLNVRHLVLSYEYTAAAAQSKLAYLGFGTPMRPYLNNIVSYMSRNLTELTIDSLGDSNCRTHIAWNVSILHFESLQGITTLVVPVSCLIPKSSRPLRGPITKLPQNLTALRITACDLLIAKDLKNFMSHPRFESRKLHSIELGWAKDIQIRSRIAADQGLDLELILLRGFAEQLKIQLRWAAI